MTEVKAKPEDFTEAEHAAVDNMAAQIIENNIQRVKFLGGRSRKVWLRMNRPEKTAKIDKGAGFIMSFVSRCLPKKELTKTI
jgi:hypothetical protein